MTSRKKQPRSSDAHYDVCFKSGAIIQLQEMARMTKLTHFGECAFFNEVLKVARGRSARSGGNLDVIVG
jgi:hypothetical protein